MSTIRTLLLSTLLSLSLPAFAFKLTPIEAEFAPARQALQTFKVDNIGGAGPVAIELTVHARRMARDGSDALTPASDDFVVFPDQIVLQPGETQSVRVQWTGDQQPAQELAYRLVAEQLPIELGSNGANRSGLKLMVKYLAALYVRPADPAAILTADIRPDTRAAGKFAVLSVRNSGNAHLVLQSPMVLIHVAGQQIELTPEQRDAVHGKNVLAGVERELLLPWSVALEQGELTVQLQAPAGTL